MGGLVNKNNVIFIISHKYFRGYESYLKYYIGNIFYFYENALIIVVDNNSTNKEDIFTTIDKNEKIIFLDNDIESKFELGAYQVGLKYIIDNNLNSEYDYIVFTQDTFILKNKYNFNQLYENNVYACVINGCKQDDPTSMDYSGIHKNHWDIQEKVLNDLGLNNEIDKISFCWCVSFIINSNKSEQLFDYLKKIIITNRMESCASERYMARIIYELNNHQNYDIDGDIKFLNNFYDCHLVDVYSEINTFFVKKAQQKTEHTKDL